MLTASPRLPLTQPAGQPAAAAIRRDPRVVLQGRSFESANTADYFRHYEARIPPPPVEEQLYHDSAQAQFEKYISGSFPLATRVSAPVASIVHFGLTNPLRDYGSWLQESLQDLAECPCHAQEEEMDEPSNLALVKAKDLLEKVANYVVDRPEIYPMQQSCIAIDFRNPDSKSGILFLIEQDGSGVLFHRTSDSKGRLRVVDAANLLKEGGLRELKRVGIR